MSTALATRSKAKRKAKAKTPEAPDSVNASQEAIAETTTQQDEKANATQEAQGTEDTDEENETPAEETTPDTEAPLDSDLAEIRQMVFELDGTPTKWANVAAKAQAYIGKRFATLSKKAKAKDRSATRGDAVRKIEDACCVSRGSVYKWLRLAELVRLVPETAALPALLIRDALACADILPYEPNTDQFLLADEYRQKIGEACRDGTAAQWATLEDCKLWIDDLTHRERGTAKTKTTKATASAPADTEKAKTTTASAPADEGKTKETTEPVTGTVAPKVDPKKTPAQNGAHLGTHAAQVLLAVDAPTQDAAANVLGSLLALPAILSLLRGFADRLSMTAVKSIEAGHPITENHDVTRTWAQVCNTVRDLTTTLRGKEHLPPLPKTKQAPRPHTLPAPTPAPTTKEAKENDRRKQGAGRAHTQGTIKEEANGRLTVATDPAEPTPADYAEIRAAALAAKREIEAEEDRAATIPADPHAITPAALAEKQEALAEAITG